MPQTTHRPNAHAPIRPSGIARAAAVAALGTVLLQPTASQAKTFELVARQDYPPFSGRDLPGKGLAVEVVKAIFESQGHKATVTLQPRVRAYKRTVSGQFDGGLPFRWSAERAIDVAFTEPVFDVIPNVISSQSAPVTFDGSAQSLANRTVCRPADFPSLALIDRMVSEGSLSAIEPYSVDKCPALVQRGRADFWVQNNLAWPSVIARSRYQKSAFHIADTGFDSRTLHVIIGRKHGNTRKIQNLVDAGLAAIRTDGTFAKLVARHTATGG